MNNYENYFSKVMGIGDWGLGPIPNPQSPIPNPQSPDEQAKKYQTNNQKHSKLFIINKGIYNITNIKNIKWINTNNCIIKKS